MEIQREKNGVYDWLLESLTAHLEETGRHWLQEVLFEPGLYSVLDRRMAAARRKVGHHPVKLQIPFSILEWSEPSALLSGSSWETAGWDVSDVARILLLLSCMYGRSGSEQIVKEAFRRGDEKEKCAIMKGILLLDPNGRLRSVCVDACRTNSLDLFASVAMGNPYPCIYFEESEFNQMVLKALFLEMDISRVQGLAGRTTSALIQMAHDFREEREAAGRTVPGSIRLILE